MDQVIDHCADGDRVDITVAGDRDFDTLETQRTDWSQKGQNAPKRSM